MGMGQLWFPSASSKHTLPLCQCSNSLVPAKPLLNPQVAAAKYLARHDPSKDIRKPTDKAPQRIKIWVQAVFIDKKYYSADAPLPAARRESRELPASGSVSRRESREVSWAVQCLRVLGG